jgi:hypothetical protein
LLILLALAAPAAPAGAAISISWHAPIQIDPASDGGITGVSCPTATLCVAVDATGHVLSSTNAGAGPTAWSRPVKIETLTGGSLTGVSCPTTTLCVTVDALGNVLTSVNPTGGASAWTKPVKIDSTTVSGGGAAGFTGVSCPATTLCVAVDGGDPGNAVTTTNPTGGAPAWTLEKKIGTLLTGVDCPSSTLCIAAGDQDYVSTNPASSVSAWHATGTQTGGGAFSAIDCPGLTLCVDAGFGNTSAALATTSITPRGAAATWTTATVQPNPPAPGAGLLDGVACISSAFCVAVDSADNVFTSDAPATGVWSAQTQIGPTGTTSTSSSIACASTLCVVVDSNGYAIAGGKRGVAADRSRRPAGTRR